MKSSSELILNGKATNHSNALLAPLKRAKHLDCMVAFAKTSALKEFLPPLKKALARGMTARFAVGLSFHLSEPTILRQLFSLRGDGLELYLSNDRKRTFHPKIYAFRDGAGSSVFVGSANLTFGGLSENYEASVRYDEPDGHLAAAVAAHFDNLIEQKVIVEASATRISDYAFEFDIHDVWRKVARKRAEKIINKETRDLSLLAFKLDEMKRDESENGFAAHQTLRRRNLVSSKRQIRRLSEVLRPSSASFLTLYERLIEHFHSGGLARQKTRLAGQATQFVAALNAILQAGKPSPEAAFETLREPFRRIRGAGVNLLTEILHAMDNQRYAVMNQNAVAGMLAAGFTGYPLHPNKLSVNGATYARYCADAQTIRKQLGLANLSELDALFNYIYWQEEDEDQEG
ncbi:phospholipase D-like domain-containing protein [Paracidovorax avenae]|uniref:phospholipase D-like domain-containing protein n=1 Tax=Paracidovorax avenae TaxID=80867 RepID=UPI000D22BBCF|nr:phospholipase D-like domain-containing protein [Paracidovorax avenae]AVT12585.1 NgoFVII family restriction endonuclease [Paracidovorax avenae]